MADPVEVFDHVKREYLKRFNLHWLAPFGFNNTYAITVRESDALQHHWRSISDLKKDAPRLRAGFTAEFSERADGYPGLRKRYNLQFRDVRDLDPAIMYQAMANGEVDVICAFATDGRIMANSLKPLNDDRGFFPPYQAAPVVREQFLKVHPEVLKALSLLKGRIDNVVMQRLNFEVDGKKRRPSDVVAEFLEAEGLI